jgi:transcriptional regulator with XRE-family HTH domain
LDLGLLQREVALRIGVDEATVFNWEAGTAFPGLRALPGVIRFLGYDPRETPEANNLGRLVRHSRQRHGLGMDALAEILGVDPSTVRGWERRGHRPSPRLHARLAEALGLPTTPGPRATLGEGLRAARLRVGLTQRELADQIGVGQQVVSSWESGNRTPTEEQGTRISEVLE